MLADQEINEIAVRRFYQALTTGELTLADEALAADWESFPPLRTGTGPDGWKGTITHLRGAFSELTAEIQDVVVSGDRVAVRSVTRARHTGELLDVAGTGGEVEFRAADFHRLAGGRITQTWHLEDYFGLARQLGLEFTRGA
ncbi:ester cyclase [Amycolatopsis sp. PS_44_ISF1]|uniref:ester cyclase n=1 Tax=Amycolatopsis sp. PS_44_ISF1 TaxID=2974917 RepID=UPI0028DF6E5F|nr:ester cyclase [Amycolatopsis sp. PS_44_ISF1]MDT8912781.1 ester cyclase [Amycolatopsis sp. PS_44_ISF1]